jgi:hypothetical protein
MNNYGQQRAEEHGFEFHYDPKRHRLPKDYDSCDWRWETGRPGRTPAYWDYVCHAACHWTCNLHLWVALEVEPETPWRIVTSQAHSTVWDGDQTLWDGNFLALGIPADEAWKLASEQSDSERLEPGVFMLHTGVIAGRAGSHPIESHANEEV